MRNASILSAVAAMLAGCAGSCAEQRLLEPSAASNGNFVVSRHAEFDELYLENKLVSVWLRPCAHYKTGSPIHGSLCGVVILAPGATLEFPTQTARVFDVERRAESTIQIQPIDFDITSKHVGASFQPTGRNMSMASKLYSLPGSRFDFAIFKQPLDGRWEIRLPQIKVNSVPMDFPPVQVASTAGRRCYHGAW